MEDQNYIWTERAGILLSTDDSETVVYPENGKVFLLDEIRKLVDNEMVEFDRVSEYEYLISGYDGLINNKATKIYQLTREGKEKIVGNALLCHVSLID